MWADFFKGLYIGSGVFGGLFLLGLIITFGLDSLWLKITRFIEKRRGW